nr:hypothetical protein [Tanacetum cinerariifolium]
MREVILFYNGLEVPTRQILDSKGAIPTKTTANAKVAIQKMAEYSQKWHNKTSKVGCELCKGPHYTKDCPLKEEGKTLEEAYYTQFGVPFQQGRQYRAAALGIYQRNNAKPSCCYQKPRSLDQNFGDSNPENKQGGEGTLGGGDVEEEEVSLVNGVFEGAFGALALEMEALVDAMEVYEETAKDKGLTGEVSSSTKKKGRTVAITAEDMQKRKNDVKERPTLLLQAIVSHLEFMDVPIEQDDLNQKFFTSLAPEWLVGKSKVPTIQRAYTDSAQVPTVSTDVIDDDDIEEMDIKWNLALLSIRADRECRSPRSQDRGKRESYKKDPKVEEPAPKAMIAIDEEVLTEYALMAKSSSSSDNGVYDDSFCSKSCRKKTENLNTKISKLNEELSDWFRSCASRSQTGASQSRQST